MAVSIAAVMLDAWESALRESPAQFSADWYSGTYRASLDRQHRNIYGDLIPRIVTVRVNIRRLNKPKRPPVLPT